MKNFIKLTKTPECETFYINSEFIHYFQPYNEGSFVVTYETRCCGYGIYVLESPQEIYALINA